MGAILSIVAGFLKLVGAIADYFRDRQLIEAGKDKQLKEDIIEEKEREKQNTDIVNHVNSATTAERERLRNKWTSGSS